MLLLHGTCTVLIQGIYLHRNIGKHIEIGIGLLGGLLAIIGTLEALQGFVYTFIIQRIN